MQATKAVIARYEAIANTTKVQGFMGDCFGTRSDGFCSDITLKELMVKASFPVISSCLIFFIGTRYDGRVCR
jgi:ornithine carbamoyltransferase